MPRPGQQSKRRKRKHDEDRVQAAAAVESAPSYLEPEVGASTSSTPVVAAASAEEDEAEPWTVAGQALPMAVLPDDFEGDASDGATYLALANRETSKLPFYKRVKPPAHLTPSQKAPVETNTAERHPALPRESWETLYAAHFKAYRAHLQSLPRGEPDPSLPKPRDAAGWLGYIQGVEQRPKKGKGRATDEEEEAQNGGMEVDEEAAMNDVDEEAAINSALVPREPLLSVLSTLNTPSILQIIRHLTFYTTATLDSVEDGVADVDDPIDPLPASHARWAFALLALTDEHLTSDDISVLRDFARAAGAAAAWRWLKAVAEDDLPPVPITEGFYGDGAPATGDVWALGAGWKRERDARPRSEPSSRPVDTGLDSDLARSWVCTHAVAAGWAQWDLLADLERSFGKLPRPQPVSAHP